MRGYLCLKCGKSGEPPVEFHPSYHNRCKRCLADAQRAYRKTRPKTYWRDKDKKYAVKKRYGLSLDQLHGMVAAQGGKCAICGVDPRTLMLSHHCHRHLHIDHDHATGRVRGLVCNGCNRALGFLNDQPDVARKAAEYLEHHATRPVDGID
jgi:hypothetical protein